MATLYLEIYEPPKKGMPFLAVGVIGTSIQFAHAAKTRDGAKQLLEAEIDGQEVRAQLHAVYGRHRTSKVPK
jgi:hypothetical protein